MKTNKRIEEARKTGLLLLKAYAEINRAIETVDVTKAITTWNSMQECRRNIRLAIDQLSEVVFKEKGWDRPVLKSSIKMAIDQLSEVIFKKHARKHGVKVVVKKMER